MMELIITSSGQILCVYGEEIPLGELGCLKIIRASHVEPDAHGQWVADMAPCNGPLLGPFARRSEALQAEYDWLTRELPGLAACAEEPDSKVDGLTWSKC